DEGPHYADRDYGGRFDFFGAMDGSEPTFDDTDSAQAAVKFIDAGKNTVGRATNAKSAAKARGNNGAATWDRSGKQPKRRLKWDTAISDKATHFELVLIYSDALYDTPKQVPPNNGANPNGLGDMPIVIGSWSADFDGKSWAITVNARDVYAAKAAPPVGKDIK